MSLIKQYWPSWKPLIQFVKLSFTEHTHDMPFCFNICMEGFLSWFCTKHILTFYNESLPSGLCVVSDHLEAGGIADKLIQRGDNLGEFGSQVPLFHPAVQHELVQCCWAVHGWGQSIVLLHSIYHLRRDGRKITITSNLRVEVGGICVLIGASEGGKVWMNEENDGRIRDKCKKNFGGYADIRVGDLSE